MTAFGRMLADDGGVSLMEYTIVFAFFAMACAWGFVQISQYAAERYTTATTQMSTMQESPLPTTVP